MAPAVDERGRERGITLVEMLVALALLGLLSLFLYQGAILAIRVFDTAARSATLSSETVAAAALIREAIESAYPHTRPLSDGRYAVMFSGDAGGIEFLTTAQMPGGVPGIQRVRIQNVEGAVSLWVAPYRGEGTAFTEPAHTLLAGRSLAIRYAAGQEGRPAAWDETWSDRSSLPGIVSIAIKDIEDDRTILEVLAAPRILRDATCRYDPMTGKCRGQ